MAISVFDFPILKWAWNIVTWIVRPINIIISALTGALASIFVMAYDAFTASFGVLDQLISFLSSAVSFVTRFVSWISEQVWFSFFAHVFAFDTFSQCASWFVGLWAATLILMAFGLVFASISAVLPFFILKSVRSIVSICSAGVLKP